MNDLASLLAILLRVFLFWLSALMIVWIFFPHARTVAAGLVLGSSVSMINAQILVGKVQLLTELAMKNETKRMSLGFLTRACFILIATMVAVRFDPFDLVSVIIGFLFFPVAVSIVGMILVRRQ